MDDNAKNMFSSLMDDDANGFKDAFDVAIKTKIADRFSDTTKEISKGLLSPSDSEENVDEAYGRSGASSYIFKSPMDAKKFQKAAMNAGANRRIVTVKGKEVTIGDIADSDVEEMLYFIAKDMKAEIKENTEDSVIIKTLQNIIMSEEPIKVTLNDDCSVKISLVEAKGLVKAHDNLNINNQRIMRNSLMESKESFDKIMNFSKNNKIGESPNVY